jgi:hypothetical protein
MLPVWYAICYLSTRLHAGASRALTQPLEKNHDLLQAALLRVEGTLLSRHRCRHARSLYEVQLLLPQGKYDAEQQDCFNIPLRVQVELKHVMCEATCVSPRAAAFLHIWACGWAIVVDPHTPPACSFSWMCKWAVDPVVAEALLAGKSTQAERSNSSIQIGCAVCRSNE